MSDHNHGAIVAESLVREFKKGPRAVDGIELAVSPGEIYGFLGPNGAGKSTTVLMLTTLLPPTSGTARVDGFDVVKQAPEVRKVIGAALQEAALDPLLTGREHLRLQASLQALPRPERGPRADELLDRVGLSQAADRKVTRLLGRHEAAARPRARARPPSSHPVPRRADDRPRHPEPDRPLGGSAPTRERRGGDRLPDDAVSRRGRRARRPRRDHRPRPDRRRGDTGRAEGRDRQADRRGRARPAARARARRRDPLSVRRAGCVGARRGGATTDGSGRPGGDRAGGGCRGPRDRVAPAPPAVTRRRVPREDRALTRGRRGEDEDEDDERTPGELAMEPAA